MRRIGVLVDLVGRYGRGILEGVTTFSIAHGHFHLVTPPPYGFAQVENWEQWQIDGLIAQVYSEEIVTRIKARGIPSVNVSTILADSGLPTVSSDNTAIGRMAAGYLLDRGFRNYAYLGAGPHYATARGDAFKGCIEEAGFICHRPAVNVSIAHDNPDVRNLLIARLRAMPFPIGIFCPNDSIAKCVLEACAEAGIAVPEQAAVLGCDNDELLFRRTHPPLSSIQIPAEQIGYQASQTLMELMAGRQIVPVQTFNPTGVLTRKSTDILAINDADVATALRFIRTHAHEQILVEHVVDRIPLSRRVFEQRFRTIVGRSPLAEIRRVQLELSQKLLSETDLAMPQIAMRCGFANASYFGISFRKVMGITPTEYRKTHRWNTSRFGGKDLQQANESFEGNHSVEPATIQSL